MKRANKPRFGLTVFLLLLILLTGFALWGVINAHTVRIVYGEAALKNLDPRLDGAKILYLSDLKIYDETDAEQALKLIDRLTELQPDAILLGGDLSGDSFVSTVKRALGMLTEEKLSSQKSAALDKFFMGMAAVSVKCPVLAVTGDSDLELSQTQKQRSGIVFLDDEAKIIVLNGAYLPVYGAKSTAINLSGTGSGAMILLFHDPNLYNSAARQASEYHHKADSCLLLSAHTLGGQIRIGKIFAKYNDINRKFTAKADKYGIYDDGSGYKMLLSKGIGCEGVPIRIGTRPEAYLITLRCADTGE